MSRKVILTLATAATIAAASLVSTAADARGFGGGGGGGARFGGGGGRFPTDGKASDATQAPTSPNYAGRTYQDYLAANPQAVVPAPQKN